MYGEVDEEWSRAAHDLPIIRAARLSVTGGKWVGLAVTLGRRGADSHTHRGWETQHPLIPVRELLCLFYR